MASNKNKEAMDQEWAKLYALWLYPGETIGDIKRRGIYTDSAYPNEGGAKIELNVPTVPGLQTREIRFK